MVRIFFFLEIFLCIKKKNNSGLSSFLKHFAKKYCKYSGGYQLKLQSNLFANAYRALEILLKTLLSVSSFTKIT